MTRIARFKRGSATYKCGICGKLTRETGDSESGSESCRDCYAISGWENALQDNPKGNAYRNDALKELAGYTDAQLAASKLQADFLREVQAYRAANVKAVWHSTRGGPNETSAQTRQRWKVQGQRARAAASGAPVEAAWGRRGSAAEAYKRIIMSGVDDDLEVHELVVKELGKGKAGPAAYAHWYRNWLTKRGHKPPRDK